MNKYWNVISGIVIVYMILVGAGWLMGRIDFDAFFKATAPVIGPVVGYFLAFLPKAGE